jgi:WD40 repeat protein
VLLVDVQASKLVRSALHPGRLSPGSSLSPRMVRFSHHGGSFITLGLGKAACLWTREGALLAELPHEASVWDAHFSSKDEFLVTACEDGTARVWDARSGNPHGQIMRHSDSVLSAQFDRSGNRIATGCRDGRARVWDWRSGQLACRGLEHAAEVHSVVFVHDGSLLLTAAHREVRFWDSRSGMPVAPQRMNDVCEPRLRVDEAGQLAIVAGSQRSAAENGMAILSLTEFEPLQDFGFQGGALMTLAEIASARRADNGSSVPLTSEEWFDRWELMERLSPANWHTKWSEKGKLP